MHQGLLELHMETTYDELVEDCERRNGVFLEEIVDGSRHIRSYLRVDSSSSVSPSVPLQVCSSTELSSTSLPSLSSALSPSGSCPLFCSGPASSGGGFDVSFKEARCYTQGI